MLSGGLASGLVELWRMRLAVSGCLEILFIIAISASLVLWRFYRDPERQPAESEGSIISPADGHIVYIKTVKNGMLAECEKNGKKYSLRDFMKSDLLQEKGTLIGIAMNFLDVHVNRAPIDGTIVAIHLIKGRFVSLKNREAMFLNQRQITIIEKGSLRIAVVQIASRLVRSIVPFIKDGEGVRKGERIGIIRFGSQVDLFLPSGSGTRINVRTGQGVKAGVTVVAEYKEAST